LDNSAVIRVRK